MIIWYAKKDRLPRLSVAQKRSPAAQNMAVAKAANEASPWREFEEYANTASDFTDSRLVERLWLSLPGIEPRDERAEWWEPPEREVERRDEEMTLYLNRSTNGLDGFEGLADERKLSRI